MIAGGTGPARTPQEERRPLSAHDCPECGATFSRAAARQIFCGGRCQTAWKARTRKRGYQLLPFAIAARVTRAGTRGDRSTGAHAHADMDMLIRHWRDEDIAAGRMTAVHYLALRYRLGFERP